MTKMTTYHMRYFDRGDKIVEGDLPMLSALYVAFVKAHSDVNHGPATLRRNGQDVGYINAKGEVWLKQPSYVLAYDPNGG